MSDTPGNGLPGPSPMAFPSTTPTLTVQGTLPNATPELPDSPVSSQVPPAAAPAPTAAPPAPPITPVPVSAPGVPRSVENMMPPVKPVAPQSVLPPPFAGIPAEPSTDGHGKAIAIIIGLIVLLIVLAGGYYAYAQGLIPGLNKATASPTPLITPATAVTPSTSTTTLLSPSPAATTPLTGDAKRKQDIDAIAAALDKYASLNNGAVPMTPKAGTTLTDQSSDLAKALTPTYLTTLPLNEPSASDPYGYVSLDGKSYTLSAVIDASDLAAKKFGNKYYYIIEGPRPVSNASSSASTTTSGTTATTPSTGTDATGNSTSTNSSTLAPAASTSTTGQ